MDHCEEMEEICIMLYQKIVHRFLYKIFSLKFSILKWDHFEFEVI
jgi:hypothetical protein